MTVVCRLLVAGDAESLTEDLVPMAPFGRSRKGGRRHRHRRGRTRRRSGSMSKTRGRKWTR